MSVLLTHLLFIYLFIYINVKKTVVYTQVNGALHIENCKNYKKVITHQHIDISPYLSEKSSDFNDITAADFELNERNVIKNEEDALDRLRVRQSVFLVSLTL